MGKSQPFLVPGMVSPKEYNWEEQFQSAAKAARKDLEPFRAFDTGKVMGLAEAYSDALAILRTVGEALNAIECSCELIKRAWGPDKKCVRCEALAELRRCGE